MSDVERQLVLLRHAKSDWGQGVPDLQRPLNGRGRRDAAAIGRWLAEHVGRIDAVACSPAQRTRETWALVAAELPDPPTAAFVDDIYEAPPGALVDVVDGFPDDATTALVIGHNPGMQMVVELLTDEEVEMKTASVAVLTWRGGWADAGGARLHRHHTPRG